MGIYKVTAPKPVLDVEPGEILEHDFAPDEEADLLAAGRLELVPREYRNIGTSAVCGAEPGKTFKHAFTAGQEAALIAGGHIERVETKPKGGKGGKPAAPEATTEDTKEG